MKKTIVILLSLALLFCFASCKKDNKADTSLKEGEIMLSGLVSESYGSTLLLEKTEGYEWQDYAGDRVFLSIGDKTEFVIDGCYVTDLTGDYFENKYISVICSEFILSTYPAQLQGERMIILLE